MERGARGDAEARAPLAAVAVSGPALLSLFPSFSRSVANTDGRERSRHVPSGVEPPANFPYNVPMRLRCFETAIVNAPAQRFRGREIGSTPTAGPIRGRRGVDSPAVRRRPPLFGRLQRGAARVLLLFSPILAATCAIPHQVSFSDRCASVMIGAFPGATLKIVKQEATVESITAVTARVEAQRTDLPKGSVLARNLAAACQFHDGILTEFHWMKGPLH